MHWYFTVLKKYAVFSGRARRKEYWMFALFNVIVMLVFELFEKLNPGFYVITSLYTLAILIPFLAVSVRRLHDTNRSGWRVLLGLIPLIGHLIVLVFMTQNGQPHENQYGPDPKATGVQESRARDLATFSRAS